jgi:hypothetical protein
MAHDPRLAQALLKKITSAIEGQDGDALNALTHPDGREESLANDRDFAEYPWKVASATVKAWRQPAWSVFKELEFYPPPVCSIELRLRDGQGNKNERFYAAAPHGRSYCICFYVDRKPAKKSKVTKPGVPAKKSEPAALDLAADTARIARFLRTAAKAFVKKNRATPVTGIQLFVSINDSFVAVNFWTNPGYKPFAEDTSRALFEQELELRHWSKLESSPKLLKRLGKELLALLRTQKDDLFRSVTLSPRCRFAVQDDEDAFYGQG